MLAFPVKILRLCEIERRLVLYSSPFNWLFTGQLTAKGSNHPSSSIGNPGKQKKILIMFCQKQQEKSIVILRCKNDTQILDFYRTEYHHRELFTSVIKENCTLFNLLFSLASLNTSRIIFRGKMKALNSDQDKTIYVVKLY